MLFVTSYNILAQSYVGLIQKVEPQYLKKKHRYQTIINHLKNSGHHIYALQEVELDFCTQLHSHLPNYRCHFSQRPTHKNDGMAFVIRNDIELCSIQSHFFINHDGSPSSRFAQRAIIQWQDKILAIVQAHISYDTAPKEQHAGLQQMKQMLAGLPHRSANGIILCGDWNAPNDHFVVEEALRSGFHNAFQSAIRSPTCWSGHEALAIDHMLHSANIQSQPIALAQFDTNQSYPNQEQGSDHLPVAIAVNWTVQM